MKKIIVLLLALLLVLPATAKEKKTDAGKASKKTASAQKTKAPEKKFDMSNYSAFENGLNRGNSDLVNAWVKHRCKYNEEIYGAKCEEIMEQALARDCISGKEESCMQLGKKYKNQEYGYIWLKYSCVKHEIAGACYMAALSVTQRKDEKTADREAMPLFEIGCRKKHRACCDMGAYVFARNKKDKVAAEMWGKVCNPADNWSACVGVGDILFKQGKLWEAMKYYERACAPNPFERQRYCRKAEVIFDKLTVEKAKKAKY